MAYHPQRPYQLRSTPIKCSHGEPDQYEQDVAEQALDVLAVFFGLKACLSATSTV